MKRFLSLALVIALVLTMCPLVFAEATYNEAPELAALVEAGELEPVADRLPKNPQVLTVAEVGKYGGTWTQATPDGTYNHARSHMTGYLDQNAMIYDTDKVTIIPNWLESFENDAEYKVFTFVIREGLRWSDGDYVTTEDVAFWWNDILKNTEFTSSDSYYYDATLEIVDDYTFKFVFETGKPMYYTYWAMSASSRFVWPSHYLKQFHPTYVEDIDAVLAAEEYDDWKTMLESKANNQVNPDLPVLAPWVLTVDKTQTNTLTFERNPYYYVVDQNGNQLPYIDDTVINIVESTDLMNMKIVAGEIDYQAGGLSESFSNYPMFAQYAEEMNYTLWTTPHNEPGALNFMVNIASKDPVKAPVLSNVEFRRALSLGMDRDSVIATFYSVGPHVSKKAQFSFLEDSPYYDEEWTNNYIDFNVDEANAKLDAMGMTQYDADGWRMTPNGEAFDLTVLSPSYDVQWTEVAEMVASQWRENLKLNINVTMVDPSLWGQRVNANDFDITDLTGSGCNGFQTVTNTSVQNWTAYTDGCDWGCFCFTGAYAEGEAAGIVTDEIKAQVERLNELGNIIVTTSDAAEKDASIKEVAQIWKDGLFCIGIGRRLPAIIVVKNYVKNVTEAAHGAGWDFGANGVVRADGIWFDK